MPSFNHLRVETLRNKCKNAGLPTTGNKKKLIERLEECYSDEECDAEDKTMANRIFELEKEISILRTSSIASSPFINTIPNSQSISFDPPHTQVLSHPFECVTSSQFSSTITPTQQSYSSLPSQQFINNNATSGIVGSTQYLNANVINPGCRATTSVTSSCYVTDTLVRPISSNYTTQPLTNGVSGMVGSSIPYFQATSDQQYAPNVGVGIPYYQPGFQHVPNPPYGLTRQPMPTNNFNTNTMDPMYRNVPNVGFPNVYHGNPFSNVKDVMSILPEFNPSSSLSMSSVKFIQKIDNLKNAYCWDDRVVIFAVQSKLLGPAKYWIDGVQEVFGTWQQFKNKFLQDFPCEMNVADVHIEMMETKRKFHETPEEYYYKMLSLGRKGELSDDCIVKYTINGINHDDLKKQISKPFSNCNELLTAIRGYVNYNPIIQRTSTPAPKPFITTPKTNPFTSSLKPQSSNSSESSNYAKRLIPRNADSNSMICYNCFNPGHLSIKCPEPPRRERCMNCLRTTHQTAACPDKRKTITESKTFAKPNVAKIEEKSVPTAVVDDFISKEIKINGKETSSFVDPGSNRTLIRKSFAENMKPKFDCSIVLTGFAGGQYVCQQFIAATIDVDNNTYYSDVLVVEDEFISENVLLGRDILCKEGNRLVIEGDRCTIEITENLNMGKDLSVTEQSQLKCLLSSQSDVFASAVSELGKCTLTKMEIKLTTDIPINIKPYRIAFAKRPIVKNIVDELLQNDIIRPSDSPYASPIVLVDKKNGESRMCVDYRQLNKITVKQPYPMPIIDDLLACLSGNKYFSTLDLKMGYHQIEVDDESKKYTAFVTTEGHYEYNRMPFGLVDAPSVFQAMMNKLVSMINPGEVIVYLDDVVIPSKTVKEGLTRLHKFFTVVRQAGLTLRLDKCKFLATEITFLGHEISEKGMFPGEGKVCAVKNFSQPSTVTEVRRFLGLTGFFRKFIKNYSLISKPLTNLLRKSEDKNFNWGEAQQQAFLKLIELLCDKPCLTLYDLAAQHELHTDASSVGLAGVLLQSIDGKTWKPVMYYSRHCTAAEQKYHSYELEVLAVVESLDRFRVYLLGKRFRLVTDCSAIARLKEKTEMIPRIARWWMRLLEYDFETIHRPGDRMTHVDALSRSPNEPAREMETAGFIMKIGIDQNDWLLTMQLQDENLKRILAVLNGYQKSDDEKQLKEEFRLKDNRLFRKEGGELKFVVPKAVRFRVVQHFHDNMGHFGIEKTIERIKENLWFPKMRRYLKSYIAACVECCYMKAKKGKPEGRLHFGAMEPIPFRLMHIDHLGPFVKSKHGNTHIIAMSDAFSKFLIVRAVRNTKTAPVIKFLNDLTAYFGLPNRIVSDRGTSFTSKTFDEYCERYNIQQIKTAVRTPRANGQVERANQTILSFICASVENVKDWDETLRDLQWTINSQKNSTTGFSPNELVFDFTLNDIIQNNLVAALNEDREFEPECDSYQKREQALQNIMKEREKWKERFDRKHTETKKYSEGDLIVIENEKSSTGESRKLDPKFRGPYVVSKVLGNDRYVVEDIKGMQIKSRKFNSIYSSDKMKSWCSSSPELDGIEDGNCSSDDDWIEDEPMSGTAELSRTNIKATVHDV